ncbi:hypothetical protein BC936DRAFT_145022, partial [Jimgerdemannia flammicorona]
DSSVSTPTRFLAECGEYTSLFTPSLGGNFSEVNPFEYSFQTQKNLSLSASSTANHFKSPDPRHLAITNNHTASQQASSTLPRTSGSVEYTVKIEPVDESKDKQDHERLAELQKSPNQKRQDQPRQQQQQHHQPPPASPNLSATSPPSPKPSPLPSTSTITDNIISVAADQVAMQRSMSEDRSLREDSFRDDDEVGGLSSPKDDYLGKRSKRRRDSDRSADDSDSSSGSYDNKKRRNSDDNDDDSEEKRRRFLERNRMAASKCRQKKKAWMQELESRSDEITNRNKALHMLVANLKEEVLMLKDQLLAHRGCGCNVIQQYVRTSGHFNMSLMNAMVNNALAGGPELDMIPQPPPPPPPPHIQHQQQMQQHHRQPHHMPPHSYPMQQSHPYEQHGHVVPPHPMVPHGHMMQQQMMSTMFTQ